MSVQKEKSNADSSLDALLDDAFLDFGSAKTTSSKENDTKPLEKKDPQTPNMWSEEFINIATENFDSTINSFMKQHTNENKESDIAPSTVSAEFAKLAQAAAEAASSSSDNSDLDACLSNVFEQLNKNKPSSSDFSAESTAEMLKSLGLSDSGDCSEQELGMLFPLMQTMLENILSKDVLYPPLKDIVAKFPDWLADKRSELDKEEFERYNKQFEVMKKVVNEFEVQESEAANKGGESRTSDKILVHMQELQELGQPPKDLMNGFEYPEMGTGNNADQMLQLSSLLQGLQFPNMGSGSEGQIPPIVNPEQCCLM